jgi:amino acid adenylation domain-containing protein/thioester reductase-like protein
MTPAPRGADEGVSVPEPVRLSAEEKRAQLRRLLERRATEPRTAPLASAQERLWFLDQLAPGTPLFNISAAMRVTGRIDRPAAERSLNEIVRRHEILRTTFPTATGRPIQRIAPTLTLPLPVFDLRHVPAVEREAAAMRAATEEAERPFDLARGPLLRMSLVQMDDDDHLLLVTMHHIVSDGWSIAVFIREALATYYAFSTGAPLTLPEPPIQYADFVRWQQEQVQGTPLQSQLRYWTEKLADLSVLELPTDRPRPAVLSPRGASCSLALPADLTRALRTLGRREDATLFMVLMAAFQTVLHRYSGQDDVVVGTLVSGRNRAELEDLIGCFINAVTIRTDFAGDPTFSQLLARVRQVALEAYAHEDVPFEKVVEALQPRRDLGRAPLFQVMFVLQGTPMPPPKGLGLTVRPLPVESRTAKFDLNLSFIESDDGLLGTLEYSTDLFEGATIARMLGHLRRVLEAIVEDPDQPVGRLPLLTEAELRQQLVEWNDTAVDYGPFRCIHEIVEAQVERTPDAVALVFEGQHLTYSDLNWRANRLAHQLQALGVGPEVCVGVCMERSLELVIALLGVLKAGGAYLPLDPISPRERLEYMLGNAQAPVLLTQERLLSAVPAEPARVICVDAMPTAGDDTDQANPSSGAGPKHLAYVIYTSGSTGQPKGVMNTHEGIRNRLLWMQEAYGLTPADRVLQKTPFTFDVSVWEFFWPLMIGACLVITRPGGHKDSAYLVRLLAEQQITTTHFVPSMLQAFLREEGLESLQGLRRVFCSGEALPVELQERFFARLSAELHNLYGPTEAAVDVTFWACRRHDSRPIVPIGRPIANTQIYILDSHRQLVPIGVPGELYIGGVGLARGYLNRPDLTAETFVPHPFGAPGSRLYRTGDRARFLPDGEIEFLGRIDHQVKIQGVRIEPAEIETALRRHPAVREVLVVQREDTPGDRRLVAYLVADESPAPTPSELRGVLRQTLPDYLIPSAFVCLEAFPLSASGKVDRRALPAPDRSRPELERDFVAPRTELETALAGIWSDVLGIEHVGVHDDFFELGGHSLLAIQLLFRVRDAFAVDVSLPTLLQHPTVGELALAIEVIRAGGSAPDGGHLDLRAEVVLDPTIVPSREVAPPTADAARVLLTGASGFVGRFVLAELLEQTTTEVYCLVRAANTEAAGTRLRESLQSAGRWKRGWESRIIPVLGDLARPRLGLSEEAFSSLATTIDAIYHGGALVNFLYPYAALKPTNVLGTQEVLRLASQVRQKPVHYLSTLAVFPVESTRRLIRECDQPEHPEAMRGGYAQSKWVAERLVALARARGLPVTIYRLSLVTSSLSGGLVRQDDFATTLLQACILLGSIPDVDVSVNAVPIDYVARALVHLSRRPDATGQTYHLANRRPIPAEKVVEYVRAFGYALRQVPYEEWLAELGRFGESTRPELLPLPRLLPERRPDMGFRTPEFDCEKTIEALTGTSIICPPIDGDWFRAYLSTLVRDGLLEAPAESPYPHG